jgi:precorrin-2/cobalt-factor-2 C20-methyltransferase
MAAAETIALIKVGRHFARLRALLDRLELAGDARYIERASLTSERVLPLDTVDAASVPYFSMILLRRPVRQ